MERISDHRDIMGTGKFLFRRRRPVGAIQTQTPTMTPHVITLPLSTLENMKCELHGRFDDLFDRLDDILWDLYDLKVALTFPSYPSEVFNPLQTVGKY